MNEELKNELKGLGLNDEQITGIEETLGVTSRDDMGLVDRDMLASVNIKPVVAIKVLRHFVAATPEATSTVSGEKPSEDEVKEYANKFGIDSNMLTTFMFASAGNASGLEMDLSSFMPIATIVAGYSPKRRDMSYMIMGQLENRLRTPIVVINPDGSVNAAMTEKYILELEDGFEPAEDGVYNDEAGNPYEVIKVGVDAQGIYDADPIDSRKALRQTGMGVGRINWHNVPLEVRQVVYFATRSGELAVDDEAKLQWLRSHITPESTYLTLRGEFPKAINLFNEAKRTGSLPTLRVTLTRTARRKETMPRRQIRPDSRRVVGDEES